MAKETFLRLFDEVIGRQAEILGSEKALDQARSAGLIISDDNAVIGISGNPHIVLLRLLKCFTSTGSLASLAACLPLINELIEEPTVTETSSGVGHRAK